MTLEQKLAGWTGPSSDSEQEKQERAERMVRLAISNHAAFDECRLTVFAKGSYKNNTNVRTDSDVDIAVQCHNVVYCDEHTPGAAPRGADPYTGIWTPTKFRSEIKAALEKKFPGAVDSSGSTALRVNSNSGRVDADVVPCFDHHHYFSPTNYLEGSRVFKTDGSSMENYPDQQLANGVAKNKRTSRSYKSAVRIMKRIENAMVLSGEHREVKSFFVECLVYNCPDETLNRDTWVNTIRGAIYHIWSNTEGVEPADDGERWLEVSECKFLFHGAQPWSRKDARDFARAAWNYLEFG